MAHARNPSKRAAAGASVNGFADRQTSTENRQTATKRQPTARGILLGWAAGHFAESRRELILGALALDETGLAPGGALADVIDDVIWLEQMVIRLADEFAASPSTFLLSESGRAA